MTEIAPPAIFPPIARVRQSFDQPESRTFARAVANAIRESRIRRARAARRLRADARQPGDRGNRTDRARGGGNAPIARLPAVHRGRDGEPRRRNGRRPARSWRSLASRNGRWAAPSAPRWRPSNSGPTASAYPSTSTEMPMRRMGSSCSIGSSRTRRSPASTRAAF